MTEPLLAEANQPEATATDEAKGALPEASNQQEKQTKSTDEGDEATPAETAEKVEAEADDAAGEPEKRAPEKYEFKAPEGAAELDAEVTEAYAKVARELDLPQEQAQKVLDEILPVMAQRAAAQEQATLEQWDREARDHEDLTSGPGFEANLQSAKHAVAKFGTDGLRKLLDGPLGSHPEVVATFAKIGKALKDDSLIGGQRVTKKVDLNDPDEQARILFG